MLHDQTNEIKNRHKQRHKTYEIEHEFKAQRAQGGLGLLSHTISVQSFQESIPKILSLERKEGGIERETERERGGQDEGVFYLWLARRERGEG